MPLQKASLIDVERNERLFFQFHPETIVERITPVWKKILPVMGSRETSHYMGTRSETVPMTLFYTLVGNAGEGGDFAFPDLEQVEMLPVANPAEFLEGGAAEVRPSIEGPARFLKALCYNDPDISRGGLEGLFEPPLVIFDWPGILQLEGHIEDLEVSYEQMDTRDLRGLTLVASFIFVEDFDLNDQSDEARIRHSTVRVMGSHRADFSKIPRRRNPPPGARPQTQTVVFSREITG